jgi:hypothetical protein
MLGLSGRLLMNAALRIGLAIVPVLACLASAAAQEPLKDSAFYPLKLGSVWHYKGGDKTVDSRITRYEPIGGQTCAVQEWLLEGTVVSIEHVAVTADGVYRCAAAQKPIVPPLRFLKLPPMAGDTWKVNSSHDGVTTTGTFRVRREDVTVPARRLNAFVSSTTDTLINGTMPFATTYWFVSGWGVVKQVTKFNNTESMFELVNYEPAR